MLLRNKRIYYPFWDIACCLLILLQAVGFVACSSDAPSNGENTSAPDGRYLRITLTMPAPDTRSNPTGGEYGDGEEAASYEECMIENLTLFIYRGSDGPNSSGETSVIYSLYVENDFTVNPDGSIEKTVLLENFLPQSGDRIIVAANYGNLSYLKNLREIRGYISDKSWEQDDSPATAHMFTMANAFNDDGVITTYEAGTDPPGSKDNPLKALVSLERTAAKIDIRFPESAVGNDLGLTYRADDSDDILYLVDILPVNVAQTPSRLLKCVTTGISDDYSCFSQYSFCGDEMLGTDGCQTNYVIEPKTALKTSSVSASDLSAWYGNTSIEYVNANYPALFAVSGGIVSRLSETRKDPYNSDCRRLTLTYANENTQHASMHKAEFLTGLLIKAIYHPATVYADANLTPLESYEPGTTFYRFIPHAENISNTPLCFSSLSEAEKYNNANPLLKGTITTFPDAVCYYHGSIRHSNAHNAVDTHLCHPMEYAIVRNNVYIISFLFTGPGTPTPQFDDPESLKINVYVRPWNLRHQSPILM